jgi:O-antigen/teichoic acid export membrane protein
MIKKIIQTEFFKASFWVFLATGIMNVGNYFYHVLMGRMLGPEMYGVLESVISVFYIVSIPFIPLTLVIVKFISAYKGRNDIESISSFYNYMGKKILIFGSLTTLGLLILTPLISSFLHLDDHYFSTLISAGFFVGIFAVLVKGTLQGIYNFFALFVSNSAEIMSKLVIAILLVFLGFKALGAFFALIASFAIGFLIAFIFIRKEKLTAVKKFGDSKEILKYSFPVLLTSLGLTSLFTTDIILVRNLFPGVEAGYYAALSVLGKIIFFGTFPITIVLFPLISGRHASGKEYKNLLFIGILITLGISIAIVSIYYSLPDLMVGLLFGSKYLSIAPLLGIFGVFIAIYSLISVLANFYLSISKTRVYIFVLASALLQIVLISLFHTSLLQIIYMSIISSMLLLLILALYFPFAIKRQK